MHTRISTRSITCSTATRIPTRPHTRGADTTRATRLASARRKRLRRRSSCRGSPFWTWKETGGDNWSMFDGAKPNLSPEPSSGCLKVALERQLARVYPLASADSNLTYGYNTDTGAFELHAQGRSGDAPTQVYIPREVIGKVTSSGGLTNETVDSLADGSRLVTASPSGGSFSITVAAAPLALTGCP